MDAPIRPILKASDFKNFDYSVLISNTTTNTDLLDSSLVRILEISERGLVLKTPKGICSDGHMLMLFVFPGKNEVKMPMAPKNKKIDGMFSITAKVQKSTPDGGRFFRVGVEFYQFQTDEWQQFLDCFKNQQKRINQIIKAVQG